MAVQAQYTHCDEADVPSTTAGSITDSIFLKHIDGVLHVVHNAAQEKDQVQVRMTVFYNLKTAVFSTMFLELKVVLCQHFGRTPLQLSTCQLSVP